MRFSLASVGTLVRSKLRSAIGSAIGSAIEIGSGMVDIADPLPPIPPIPLTLDRRSLRVRYRCAIAQRLAAMTDRSPFDLATDIATVWQESDRLAARSLAVITAHPNGSLDLELTDRAIGAWLDALSRLDIPQTESRSISNPLRTDPLKTNPLKTEQSFAMYYALDRCHSLIAAAEAEGWFDRRNLAKSWCDASDQLRLALSAERQAIVGLIQAIDEFDQYCDQHGDQDCDQSILPNQRHQHHPQKLADRLAANFETLHRHSRPWHAHRTQDTATATARLGLFLGYAHTLQTFLNAK